MPQLTYLLDEIGSGMEIYYSSRMGGRYLKTAFILCDDYIELVSKFWLVNNVNDWSDKRTNGSFKSFHNILDAVVSNKSGHCHPDELKLVRKLVVAMKERRKRRNDFFHSTHLLDLNVNKRGCVEAYCDLAAFGEFLFSNDWRKEIAANAKLETLCVLFKLERLTFANPTIEPKINALLESWPRREKDRQSIPKKGTQYVKHPEDLHLRLCLDWGGRDLTNAINALLSSV